MLKSLLFGLCLWVALSFSPCQPFGPRTFYGQIAQNMDALQKLQIYFNTAKQCNQSYIQLVKKSGLEKINCTITALHLSKNVNNYSTFIHKCSISSINFEETFNYNIFGWDGSSSNPIPFSKDFIPIKIADITNSNRKINLIVLADWSHLDKNIGKYTPLDDLFAKVSKEKQINGLMVNGDVGYDLDTNNCLNYQSFLVMLGQTAKSIPVIMVTGNHEYNTKDNYALFQQSFQLYKLDTKLATHLQIGSIYLLPFDPFEIVLGSSKTDPCIANFNTELAQAKKSTKFIVPISHYPLACSGTSKNCKNDRSLMKNYWNAMFDAKITFYLGAHYHTYQRVYPYHVDNTFSHEASGYKTTDPFIVSIVEGVAGNDRDIVESIATIEDFTASYTVNQTGFGLLQVDNSLVSYTHYSTVRGVTDHTTISRVAKGNIRSE